MNVQAGVQLPSVGGVGLPCEALLPTQQSTWWPAGVVVAVKGHVLPNGDFEVSDMCYAGVPPQPPRPAIDQPK